MIRLPCVLASSLALAAAAAAAAIEAFDEPGEDATVGSAPDALVPSFPAVSIAGDRWIDRLAGDPDQGAEGDARIDAADDLRRGRVHPRRPVVDAVDRAEIARGVECHGRGIAAAVVTFAHDTDTGRDTNELEHLAAAIVLVKGERDTVDDEG